MRKTETEISGEIWKLERILPYLRQGFITDNRKCARAQIEALKTGRCPDWAYGDEDDLEPANMAIGACEWARGKEEAAPSQEWAEFLGFSLEPVSELEAAIGIPAKEWPGRCTEIADKLQKSGLGLAEKTTAHYGHWTGPINPERRFANRSVTHHGWLQKEEPVIDPTRWVFENSEPYIYVGKNDHYDDGGQELNMKRVGKCPAPQGEATIPAPKDPRALKILKTEGVTQKKLTMNQACHLANLPPKAYKDIGAVHGWLTSHKLTGLIPIDFRRLAKNGS